MEQVPLGGDTSPQNKVVPIVVASILVSALIAGGGVYAYQKSQASKAQEEMQAQIDDLKEQVRDSKLVEATPSPTPQASSTPVATASPASSPANTNINTYSSSAYGFSFTYPKSWKVAESTDAAWKSSLHLGVYDPAGRNAEADRAGNDLPNNLTVDVYKNIKELDSNNLGATNLKNYLDKSVALADPTYKNVKTFTVGNKTGYSAEAGPNQFGGGTSYFVSLNDGTIVKVWEFLEGSTNTKDIIKSFNFTK